MKRKQTKKNVGVKKENSKSERVTKDSKFSR